MVAVKGISYVVDESGRKRAVQIDLDEWGELWEDFYDVIVSRARRDEPDVPWEDVKAELEREDEEVG